MSTGAGSVMTLWLMVLCLLRLRHWLMLRRLSSSGRDHRRHHPDEARQLPVGQWVIDANGTQRCLVDTNVGWPQRMFMNDGGRGYTGIDYVAYPLRLADVVGECPHSWGTQECGHCRSCGAVVAEPKNLDWNISILGGGEAS